MKELGKRTFFIALLIFLAAGLAVSPPAGGKWGWITVSMTGRI